MIKKGFQYPSTIERLQQGPLSKHLDSYSALLIEKGYGQDSIKQQTLVIADFSAWLKKNSIALRTLNSNDVDRFLRLRQQQHRVRRGDPIALKRMLAMLCEIGVVKQPIVQNTHSKAANDFQRYLLDERGLSTSTLLNYVPVVEQFLSERFSNKTPNLHVLCADDVTGFVVRQARRLSAVQAKLVVTALRSFLRYLLHRGDLSTDLSGCV